MDNGQVEMTPLAGDSLNQFFQETDVISGKIQQFTTLIQEIDAQFLRNLNADAAPNSPGQKQLEDIVQRANALSNEIYARLNELTEANKRVRTQSEFEARKGRTTTLCTQFKSAVQRYQSVQYSNRQKAKEKTRRIYQIANPNATPEEIEKAADEQHIGQIFSQQLLQGGRMQQANTTLNALQTRQQEIKQLEESAIELARLYQQMEVLIKEQDVQFHQIEQNVDNAVRDIEKGGQLTGQAVVYATLARRVHPILKSRGWKVGKLEEFFPAQKSLLGVNVNQGQKIQIRLRQVEAPDSFYPFDDLIGTMLHEMTHIVHGPHNVAFYNLFKDLNVEYDKLLDSGYRGQGFDAPGHQLGTGSGGLRNRSVHEDRAAALKAAEKRRRLNEMMIPAGGVRLGGEKGASGGRKKDADEINWEQWHRPGELAVMAAERRLKDKIWCGTEDEERIGEASQSTSNPPLRGPTTSSTPPPLATKSEYQQKSSSTQKLSDTPNRGSHTEKQSKAPGIVSGKRKASDGDDDDASVSRTRDPITMESPPSLSAGDKEWACPQCTLINRPLALQCDCCLAIRPLNC
ncbi:hypothetical protein BGW41_000176 [Actinomortierella wolfii]|nr:hypothetical protein BGW41_000176 [Actinomortierella wolfii]